MKLMITKDGSFYLGDRKLAIENMADEIRRNASAGQQRKLYLIADGRARYRDVSVALDEMRRAGLRWVVVLAEEPYLHR